MIRIIQKYKTKTKTKTKAKAKAKAKGKGTAAYFEKAYWQVMEQVEAPVESINALLSLMYNSFEAGLPPAQMRYLLQYLPDGQWQWRWPEYERQLLQNHEQDKDEDDDSYTPSNRELLEPLVNRIFILAYGLWGSTSVWPKPIKTLSLILAYG
ncbi:MAG: hypothetical protein LZF61_05850 [Nitrosomonas sp.]|nr:MAG: hypothetical protein LZF61_05850 [Nitrosomonas sp.]